MGRTDAYTPHRVQSETMETKHHVLQFGYFLVAFGLRAREAEGKVVGAEQNRQIHCLQSSQSTLQT